MDIRRWVMIITTWKASASGKRDIGRISCVVGPTISGTTRQVIVCAAFNVVSSALYVVDLVRFRQVCVSTVYGERASTDPTITDGCRSELSCCEPYV